MKRISVVLFTGLLCLICTLPCFAAENVAQVNVHIGQTANEVYFTYSAPDTAQSSVTVVGPQSSETYTAEAKWSNTAKKYLYSLRVDDLTADTHYTYRIADSFSGSFQTAPSSGAFTFAFLADTQIGFSSDARATAAMFAQLNQRNDIAFAYLAGDLTDAGSQESQWELLFQGGGAHAGAGQTFLGNHLLAVTQGNHDRSAFAGHVAVPSASADVGPDVYAFDYSNVKYIILNMCQSQTRAAQADFLRQQVASAKASGQWVVVGFHQSLYSGAAHIVDSSLIAARKLWTPLFSELGVDVVLQGHDHVYARGFVTKAGKNADIPVIRNAYHAGSGAPLYLTGGESGAVKWYAAQQYKVSAGDPLAPQYSFLDINSAVPSQNPFGTDSSKTHEQTYTIIHVDGDAMTFSTYMFRYDGKQDRMLTAPYLYDSLILRKDAAVKNDLEIVASASQSDSAPSFGYKDVPAGAWYENSVNAVTAKNLIDSRTPAQFAPDDLLTRGQVVTALYRMSGQPSGRTVTNFPDVSASSPQARAISWAVESGLVAGLPDGRFAPDTGITRAQLMTILYRYKDYFGDVTPTGSGTGTYADWRQIADWCTPSMSWAVEVGLLQGKEGNRLDPNGSVTRAEGAVFLSRLISLQ